MPADNPEGSPGPGTAEFEARLRRIGEDGARLPDDLGRVHRSGTEGVTPRFTVGMGVGMGALRGSADLSMSGNPSLNVGVGIPIH